MAPCARRKVRGMKTHETITAAGLGAELSQEPPEWIELIPTGAVRLSDGRGPFRLDDAAGVIARSFLHDSKLPIDVDHGTERGTSSAAAGWITEMEERDGAIWARVEWNEQGRGLIAGQVYRRISPSFLHEKATGRIVAIARAGLVNNPAIPTLRALTAAEETTAMMSKIAAALGLSEDASEEDILAEISKLKTPADGGEPAAAETAARLERIAAAAGADPKAEDGGEAAICAALTAAKPDPKKYVPIEALDELRTEVASLTGAAKKREAEELVAAAKAAGQVSPAMEDWALSYASSDPDGFRDWAGKTPQIVRAGRVLAVTPDQRKDGELTEVDLEIAAACGVSPEAYAKTKTTIATAQAARTT